VTTDARTLILFGYDWDASAFARLKHDCATDHAGFDLFSFPSYLRLATFDLRRFVDELAVRALRRGWQAVVSHHEQFGARGAAVLAQRMGWPGPPGAAVVACQHKLHARQVLQRVAPEANIPFVRLDARYGEPIPAGLCYPAFAKPVKAAFSVLARRVGNHQQLTALTRFGPLEQWIIHRLVEPFDAIARARLGDVPSAHGMLLEEPVDAPQYNLDGYVFNDEVHAIGVCDAVMYPGTGAFQRFERPSRLGSRVQQRALDVATRFLKAVGFTHGFFNMEFFYDASTDALKVIEFNPRLASQLADLYRRVDGLDAHAGSLALARGEDPQHAMRCRPSAGAAASFVFRCFDRVTVPRSPTRTGLRAFFERFPDAWLQSMPKQGRGLARDFKWLGSHRYGVMHLGGDDVFDLHERYRRACALLGWPVAESRDMHAHAPTMPVARRLPNIEGVPG
jgi:hypothetical protein